MVHSSFIVHWWSLLFFSRHVIAQLFCVLLLPLLYWIMDVVTLLLLFKEHINNAGTCLLCLKFNEN